MLKYYSNVHPKTLWRITWTSQDVMEKKTGVKIKKFMPAYRLNKKEIVTQNEKRMCKIL